MLETLCNNTVCNEFSFEEFGVKLARDATESVSTLKITGLHLCFNYYTRKESKIKGLTK